MASVRTWCLMTSDENWRICKIHEVWGLDFGYQVTRDRFISRGDAAILYVNRRGLCAAVEVG